MVWKLINIKSLVLLTFFKWEKNIQKYLTCLGLGKECLSTREMDEIIKENVNKFDHLEIKKSDSQENTLEKWFSISTVDRGLKSLMYFLNFQINTTIEN